MTAETGVVARGARGFQKPPDASRAEAPRTPNSGGGGNDRRLRGAEPEQAPRERGRARGWSACRGPAGAPTTYLARIASHRLLRLSSRSGNSPSRGRARLRGNHRAAAARGRDAESAQSAQPPPRRVEGGPLVGAGFGGGGRARWAVTGAGIAGASGRGGLRAWAGSKGRDRAVASLEQGVDGAERGAGRSQRGGRSRGCPEAGGGVEPLSPGGRRRGVLPGAKL